MMKRTITFKNVSILSKSTGINIFILIHKIFFPNKLKLLQGIKVAKALHIKMAELI